MYRRLTVIGAAFLLTCFFGFFCAGPVQAEITYLNTFGGEGSDPGDLLGPWGVCINESNGDVFISEYGIYHSTHNDYVQRFDRSGNYINRWDTGLNRPTGIDIGSDGYVYVCNHFNNRIDVLTTSGTFIRTFGSGDMIYPQGLAISAVNNNIHVTGTNSSSCGLIIYNSSGTLLKTIAPSTVIYGVDIGPTGNIYSTEFNNGLVSVYDSDGNFLRSFGSGLLASPRQIAVNSLGNVYVVASGSVYKFDETDNLTATISITGLSAYSVAISETGELYVLDKDNHNVRRFFDSDAWVSGQNSFSAAAVGAGQLLGETQILTAAKQLVVAGETTVKSGGSLELQGGLMTTGTYVQEDGGKLTLGIRGLLSDEYDSIAATSLAFDGTLEISLSDGVTLSDGDEFDLFDSASITGTFDNIILPDLEPGLAWDTSELYSTGAINVVPEPASLSLLAVAGLAIIRRRR